MLLQEIANNAIFESQDPIIAESDMVIYNVPRTADESLPDNKSFIQWWCDQLGLKALPTECAAADDHATKDSAQPDVGEIVGAHVRIKGVPCSDQQAWIVPLCKSCNQESNTGPILVKKGTRLVPIAMNRKHPGGRG